MPWLLVTLRGLRRGEVAGLRWVDVDPERRELTIAHQLVHTDEGLVRCEPESAAGRRTLALDPETVRLLRRHSVRSAGCRGSAVASTGVVYEFGMVKALTIGCHSEAEHGCVADEEGRRPALFVCAFASFTGGKGPSNRNAQYLQRFEAVPS
ncbi:hypothetical protein [Nonomuraea sp. GTA35]|uniref:hypothetical protein n=1 Tax=Nonomuraea sp. GTA35 TaxID=1676746 RepID=UPI0035C2481A